MTNLAAVLAWIAVVSSTVSAYAPRRNVADYGAKGDGVTDDTAAIIRAITEGRADDPNASYPATYSSSTLTPALVYFPPGTYVVTDTLPLIYYTQLVGDADSVPTLKVVHSSSVDLRVIDSLSEEWGGGLVNQNNFFHQVRNFVIDMTECNICTGIHWQVAQATQLQNLHFKMGANSQGIWMENGSGGFMSDLVFDGGKHAMWVGNQQFTSRNITIRDASEYGIYLNWAWSWTFKSLDISNTPIGVDVGSDTGSLSIVDSKFSGISQAAVRTPFGLNGNITPRNVTSSPVSADALILDNVLLTASSAAAVVLNGDNIVLPAVSGADTLTKSWVQGRVWQNGETQIVTRDLFAAGEAFARPSSLLGGQSLPVANSYFEKPRPAFDSSSYKRVNAATDLGISSDGTTDVTAALQNAIDTCAAEGSVLFLPHGTYLLSDTLTLPAGTRILGEAWSVLMVTNAANKFSDPANPYTAIKVGQEGESGVAQLVDLLITTQGPLPGAKLVEWNMADPAGQPGSAGMWEVHFRIGGAIGTNISPSNCPRGDGANATAAACAGTYALMHITSKATAYLENVWGWVADHDLDFDDQINVYNARGLLVESQGPVWMYGTAFEHSLLYQYNLHGAKDVLMAMIQTETPYFQPSANTPFSTSSGSPVLAADPTDPTFCTNDARCDMAYGLTVQKSSDVVLYGAGTYSFFNMWDQSCLHSDESDAADPDCQLAMNYVSADSKAHLYNFNTYGAVYMLTAAEAYSDASKNMDTFCSNTVADLVHSA